jgi:hypothetical protein
MRFPLGRVLISFSALAATVGAYVADWNETHIFNLWSKRWRGPRGLEAGVVLASVYWLTQAGSLAFPGTALTDPEFAARIPAVAGVPINQLVMDVFFLAFVAVGFFLEAKRDAGDP